MARYSLFVLKVPLNPKQTNKHHSVFVISLNTLRRDICRSIDVLSLRFNGHFPGGPALAGTRMSSFWILLELRMMEVVVTTGAIWHAKLQPKCHRQQTNTQFLQVGCPSCRPTNSVKALLGCSSVKTIELERNLLDRLTEYLRQWIHSRHDYSVTR